MINKIKKARPFLGRYREIQVAYDFDTLIVEVDGMTSEGFWESLMLQSDVNNPQEYALGIYDTLVTLYPSIHITVLPTSMVSDEGWLQGE